MSNEMAVAAVTLTMQSILSAEVKDKMVDPPLGVDLTKQLFVTSLPPHVVRTKHTAENVVNLFLYRTEVNAAWRNHPMPPQGGHPPLAINLEYLITAYGEDDREIAGHYLLGQAMRVLHDRPTLSRERLQLVFESAHVHDQIESVTVSPRTLSVDEMSKLWSTFQTQYRLSASYLITVLLIESTTPSRSALPVLKRGEGDRGVFTTASSMPVLLGTRPRSGFPSLRLGEELLILGENFDIGALTARLQHRKLENVAELPVTVESATKASIKVPDTGDAPHDWPAGLYSLSLSVKKTDLPAWPTNEVSFALAPTITLNPTTHNLAEEIEVEVTSVPRVRDGQQVAVIYNDAPIAPKSIVTPNDKTQPSTIKAAVPLVKGKVPLRVRIDGVDSIPVKIANGLPSFDKDQSIEVP